MTDDDKSNDIFGLKPFAKSVEIATQGVVTGAGAFLSRICLPAAEELGFLFQDKVKGWRGRNISAVLDIAEQKANTLGSGQHAHPRIISRIIEESSWADDTDIQEKWAGLIASSCTEDGNSQDNLHFVDLLSRMTPAQVRIISWACENAPKHLTTSGLVMAGYIHASVEEFHSRSKLADLHVLDREIDHLRGLELISPTSGLSPYLPVGQIEPTSIALQMYVRCQGSMESPDKYFEMTQMNHDVIAPNSSTA